MISSNHSIDAPAFEALSASIKIPGALEEVLSRLPAVLYRCGPPPSYATTFVTENVLPQFGYTAQEFYADPFFWTKHIHVNDRERILAELASIDQKEFVHYEYRFRRIDGEYSWLHDQVSVLRDDRGEILGLVGCWFDISDRRNLEMLQLGQAQVLDSLVKRRSLEESLTHIVRVMEAQNPGMVCSILRFDPTTQTLRHGAAPSLPDHYNRQVDGVAIGPQAGSCGTAGFRRSRVVVTDIDCDPLWADYREMARGIGMKACWSQPIVSSTNQLLGTFAMYYRETRGPTRSELKLIEQAAILAAVAIERYHDEEMIRHTERLVSLGTLSAGIAHEINNPIGGIQLAVQCAVKALTQGNTPRLQSMLELIAADAERCAKIVRGVLQFGRRNVGHKQTVSLPDIIKSACQLTCGYAAERGAMVDFTAPDAPVNIVGLSPELEQVFVNLIRNAIESMDRGARVGIQVASDADFGRATVSDDGRGMNDHQKARIFDPFFTTRQREGGTGLGMSIAHGIIAGHGGTIRVHSKPDRGTSVVVCLPLRK